jgi:hypothetical protein
VFTRPNLRPLLLAPKARSQPAYLTRAFSIACAHFAQTDPHQIALIPFPFMHFRTLAKTTGDGSGISNQDSEIRFVLVSRPVPIPSLLSPFLATLTMTKGLQPLYLPHIRKKGPSPRKRLIRKSPSPRSDSLAASAFVFRFPVFGYAPTDPICRLLPPIEWRKIKLPLGSQGFSSLRSEGKRGTYKPCHWRYRRPASWRHSGRPGAQVMQNRGQRL